MNSKIDKNKIQNILIVVLVIAIVIMIGSMFISDGTLFAKRNTYVFSPEMCKLFFSTTPEDFFEEYYSWYASSEDFREHASIDKDGNLVLRLTEEQENAHIMAWNSNLEEFKKVSGVEISDDYSNVIITGTKEEIRNILRYKLHIFLFVELSYRQLYSGKKPETITVTFTLIESSTGKTVYTATWPQETITITFNMDELPFSE